MYPNKYFYTNMSPSEKSCERVLDPYHISFVFLLSLALNFFIIDGIFMDSSRKMFTSALQSAFLTFCITTNDERRATSRDKFNFRVAWLCVIDRRSKIIEWAAAMLANYFCGSFACIYDHSPACSLRERRKTVDQVILMLQNFYAMHNKYLKIYVGQNVILRKWSGMRSRFRWSPMKLWWTHATSSRSSQ